MDAEDQDDGVIRDVTNQQANDAALSKEKLEKQRLEHLVEKVEAEVEYEEMWHEARRSERKVHDIMDAARRRAERRAVFLAKRRGDPHQQLKLIGTRCRMHHDAALYQATQDQSGLIPWNGKKDVLIDRFDGRALLDFIREIDKSSKPYRQKTEEEEELEELVNFERYRDLIKHRRRGFNDEEGLHNVEQEIETKVNSSSSVLTSSDRQRGHGFPTGKGTYSQVGFTYEGNGHDDVHRTYSDDDDDDDDDDSSSSGDSQDEKIERIGKEHGIQRFNTLVHMDRKAKAAEKRQKEASKGDPTLRKLSRKERRKASQQERERERAAARISGYRYSYNDPYREPRASPNYDSYYRLKRTRSRSRSPSPSLTRSRRHDSSERNKGKQQSAPKIEFITEFGGDGEGDSGTTGGIAPPSSPPPSSSSSSSQLNSLNRHPAGGHGLILEAFHGDPAVAPVANGEWNSHKEPKPIPSTSTSSALAKLSKPPPATTVLAHKTQHGEKKETPQERLKRIMSKQLNRQIKKDTMSELAKKKEQERQRQEKLAETRKTGYHHKGRSSSRSRSRSHSPSSRYDRSRSRSPIPRSIRR